LTLISYKDYKGSGTLTSLTGLAKKSSAYYLRDCSNCKNLIKSALNYFLAATNCLKSSITNYLRAASSYSIFGIALDSYDAEAIKMSKAKIKIFIFYKYWLLAN